MDRIQKEILLKEVKNFKQINKEYKYKNINELIGHYVEENIVVSKKELLKVIKLVKNRFGINIDIQEFEDCWAN